MAETDTQHSLTSLLCTEERDFLIRNNGEQVKIEDLEGKIVGLYFSAHWCPPCRAFTPILSGVYTKLVENGDFEIIFISEDKDEKSFEEYHKTMPWLALPFSDKQTKEKLDQEFDVEGIPTLIILDQKCKTISTDGVSIIGDYGAEAYPFTKERLGELKAEEEAIRLSQSLNSLLVSPDRDFVIGNGDKKVPIVELVGKTVCLYFSAHWCPPCRRFTPKLLQFYTDLKSRGEELEIVFISSDQDAESFQVYFGSMPWLALPYGDQKANYLERYFEIEGIPTLIVLGPDGKTLQTEAVELVMDHGVEVYPFTKEKLDELKAKEEAIRAAQTLESLLVSDERDFVITNSGGKVPVSELTGKTVGLYFSAHWCPPCRGFTPKLVQVYNKLKENGEAFEIVFLSSDKDQEAFEEYYASMPWLALPFGDKVKEDLSRYFSIKGIPSLVVVGPDGKTVRTDARNLLSVHGAKAYPFTDARLVELEKEMEVAAEKYPKEIQSDLHEHSLNLIQRKAYFCDGCQEEGSAWSFYCKECDFDLHPDCALKDNQSDENEKQQTQGKDFENVDKPAEVICEGDVCRRV
ncbi:probable nucleoredoxin 1 [Cryptomeria japonica]|uniref:probable nucleoredoxin 1 n=1 Tax=Cryptomeria japonica TaxID=3369 RepID=UPI0027DA261A|nr:probable nucleoredoxin 1 [Cryptomeria japonica]